MESQLTKEREAKIEKARATKKLTLKESIYCKAYLETGNKTAAAKRAYDTSDYDTQRAIGYEKFTKPHILSVLRDCGVTLEENLRDMAFNAKSENVKLGATQTALAYIYGKPTERIDLHSDSKTINVESMTLLMAHLTQGEPMQALGQPEQHDNAVIEDNEATEGIGQGKEGN